MSSREEKMYKCSECVYATNIKCNLIRHRRTHTGEKPFPCDQCNSAFVQKSDLITHRRTHTGEKPFQCDQCNFASARKWDLNCHRRTHTGEKPFPCDQCNFTSAQKAHMISHKRRHSDEKPFGCTKCGYRTKHKNNLLRHERTRHSQGAKTHKCPSSDQNFATNKTVQVHRRIHDPSVIQIGVSNNHDHEVVRQSQPLQFNLTARQTGGRYCLEQLRRLKTEQIESLTEKPHCAHAVKTEVAQPDTETAAVERERAFGSDCLKLDVSCVKQEPFYDFIDQVAIATVVTREELEYRPAGDRIEGVPRNPDTRVKSEFPHEVENL